MNTIESTSATTFHKQPLIQNTNKFSQPKPYSWNSTLPSTFNRDRFLGWSDFVYYATQGLKKTFKNNMDLHII